MPSDNELPPPSEEERLLLQMAPLGKDLMDMIREILPAGTHFSLCILAPPTENAKSGNLVVLSTDRDVMVPNVAQWCLKMLS